jgi:hypothetical protein
VNSAGVAGLVLGGVLIRTHEVATPTDLFGNRRIICNPLKGFPVEQIVQWSPLLGVELK